MDPERQPLLNSASEVRCRRLRPLTPEEVISTRNEVTWRRTRFCLVLMFWAIITMFLSMIACILMTSPKCNPYDLDFGPSVAPVHLTLAPLISSGRTVDDKLVVTTPMSDKDKILEMAAFQL